MFQLHRIFCATPWELEAERDFFHDVIGRFNETAGMPAGVLFVPVTLTNIRDTRPLRLTIDDNIRECRYYIQLLLDEWGPPERNFRRDYHYALQCKADPALPMQDVAVLFKNDPTANPPADGLPTPQATFSTREEFEKCLNDVLSAWLQTFPPLAAHPAP